QFWERFARASIDRLTNKDDLSWRLLVSLALVEQFNGRQESAIDRLQVALPLMEQALGENHREYGIVLGILAHSFFQLGRFEEAESTFERAKRALAKSLGPEHPVAVSTMVQSARPLMKKGKFHEAIEVWQRALAIDERVLGNAHIDTATVQLFLASAYLELE